MGHPAAHEFAFDPDPAGAFVRHWLRPGGGPRSTPGLNREFTLDRMLESTLHVYRELTASPR
jgi:hypothetical protein